MAHNPNKKEPEREEINWQVGEGNELHSSEWFGALIRYFLHFGKRKFNTFYNPNELKRNALVGYCFKVVLLIIVFVILYHYSQ